jgi:hypothetical protein
MTPADLARDNAISFECKKDTLRQNQSGDWKIAFTVQGLDMDERLTKAFPGTRYMAVLVEIGADELPVYQPKEVMPNPQLSNNTVDARPLSAPKSAGAKREKMDWRELQPAAQAGIRCADPVFAAFIKENRPNLWRNTPDIAVCVRTICCVTSRSELGTNHRARVLWHQLDAAFQAWQAKERIGA